MKFELQFKVYSNLNVINNHIEIKKHPYTIKLFKEKSQYYISISKEINSDSKCLPRLKNSNEINEIILPEESSYSDMIEYINHIESFGAVDNKIEYIDKIDVEFKWIAENKEDYFSPLSNIKRRLEVKQNLDIISEDWLLQTVIHKKQLGDLYIPFSFFRDGKQMFHSTKYQTAFCTFYLMLEYFFHDEKRGWGINNNAYKYNIYLQNSLNKTLNRIKIYSEHYEWLNKQLLFKNKNYDEDGLLTIINSYRNNFSHASNKNKNRNIFNEHRFFSLAFITLVLCNFVIINKRLSPFRSPS